MNYSTCKWPECDGDIYGRGFCKPHHHKSWRAGHVDKPWLVYEARQAERDATRAAKQCKWPGCAERKVKAYGMCLAHYRRAEVLGDMAEPWLSWRPTRDCEECGAQIVDPIHNKRFCSPLCFRADYRKRNLELLRERGRENTRRRRAQKLATQVDKFTDKDVRLAYGDDCYLCGQLIDFKLKRPHLMSPSLDHVIPLSRGGTHTLDNAAMVHLVCNFRKGVKDAPRVPQQTLLAL